jgi:hypothetical protein
MLGDQVLLEVPELAGVETTIFIVVLVCFLTYLFEVFSYLFFKFFLYSFKICFGLIIILFLKIPPSFIQIFSLLVWFVSNSYFLEALFDDIVKPVDEPISTYFYFFIAGPKRGRPTPGFSIFICSSARSFARL